MKYRLLLLMLMSLSIVAAKVTADDSVQTHDYTIAVNEALSRLRVEARFASPTVDIRARSSDANQFLMDVRDCSNGQKIRVRGRRMILPAAGIRCVDYKVDLAKAAGHDKNYRGLASTNIIVSPSIWLWRPPINQQTQIRARFRLPDDVLVSVPWQTIDKANNQFRISRSPESGNALAVFGQFDYDEVHAPGTTLRVALLDVGKPINRTAILDWIRGTANDVSLAYGQFPNPSPQIVVVPVANLQSDSAVPFGRVIRDGGETVQLFVNADKPASNYAGDWTATHEFSHLMLPYLRQKHRWIAEGFAQYYQNVLLARAGLYSEQFAWQKIYDGLERGRKSHPELSPNQAAEGGVRNALMKMYWSGAAIALMADVQLRVNSGGTETLDSVLSQLQKCCLPAGRMWTGIELFRKLDTLSDQAVFIPLYRRYANQKGFPDTAELLHQLGLAISNGEVRLLGNPSLGEVRASIMRANSTTPAWRDQLAAR